MVDGVASLMTVLIGLRHAGKGRGARGTNFIDSGAPFYEVYECADGKYLSIGPIEDKFYRQLLQRLDIDPGDLGAQWDEAQWPKAKAVLAARFKTRTRDEWERLFEGAEVCVSPVLDFEEAYEHPHLLARRTFIDVAGVVQPAPGPRFSRTAADRPEPPAALTTANAEAALREWLAEPEVAAHRAAGHFI
jgi:crotonobetainyl-CoA:carnitine CoA-transferase CaiB-like acyl-CoA transferase